MSLFGGDPNDPNGDVQKLLGCGCLALVAAAIAVIWAVVRFA